MVLPYLQGSLNNSKNASTGYAPNELAYGFCTNDTLDTLSPTDLPAEDYTQLRQIYCEDAEQAIAFANATTKSYYDMKHRSVTMNVGFMVYLRLHHEYTIPGLTNRKLSNQRVCPFQILKYVSNLAYCLELPPTMRIHPVVLIVQLEPASKDNSYDRNISANSPPVKNEDLNTIDNIEAAPSYKIERLLDKRTRHYGRDQPIVKYLVK